jgi:glycosyltransferase involved in cell wall biosynthesis
MNKFSICIPTYNRGSKALNQVLTTLPLIDEDWEILVLDNCSSIFLEEYAEIDKISKIDSRVKYIRHPKNLEFHGNVLSCLKLSNSNYIQIISDEDFSNPPVVRDALKVLNEFPDVGLFRGSIAAISGMQPRNSSTYADSLWSSGREALGEFSLTTNYISGIIYNKSLLNQHDIINKFENGIDSIPTIQAYAHMYLDILIASSCKVMTTKEIVCIEGDELNYAPSMNSLSNTLVYSFGGRLEQIIAFRDAFREVCGKNELNDLALLVYLYQRLINKYIFLLKIDDSLHSYRNLDARYLKESLFNFCISASHISEFTEIQDKVHEIINEAFSKFFK